MLDYVPASLRVVRHVRPKYSCKRCERVVEAAAPSRPIERGLPGPGLLAHVLAAKYCEHQPLYRQSEIYAREGVELDRSTLAGWVGAASQLLAPVIDALQQHVVSASKVHADDTPAPVLAPGTVRPRRSALDLCSRRPTGRPQCSSRRVVRLLARPAWRSSTSAPGVVSRRVAGRWLRRVPSSV